MKETTQTTKRVYVVKPKPVVEAEGEETGFVTDEWMKHNLFLDHGKPITPTCNMEVVSMRRMSKMKVR